MNEARKISAIQDSQVADKPAWAVGTESPLYETETGHSSGEQQGRRDAA
jgi:hypothetical protein